MQAATNAGGCGAAAAVARGRALSRTRAIVSALLRHPDGHLGPLESEFRRARLPGDRALLRWLLRIWVCMVASVLLGETLLFADDPAFGPARRIDLANLLVTLCAILVLGRVRTPATVDLLGGAWFLIAAILFVAAQQASGPRIFHGGAVLVLASFPFLLPLPFLARLVPAAIVLAASVRDGGRAVAAGPELLAAHQQDGVALVLACGVGLVLSTWHQRYRRRAELEARAQLRAATRLAELRRLIPVCAYCGQWRRDDGFWERARSYLVRRGILRGTEGLCERCAVRGPRRQEESSNAEGRVREAAPPVSTGGAVDDPEDLEARARRARLPGDRWRLGALVTITGLFYAVDRVRFVVLDAPPAWTDPVVWGGWTLVVVSALTLPRVFRLRTPRAFDRLAFGWVLVAVALSSLLLLVNPQPNVVSPILGVLLLYLLVQLPAWKRALPAGVFSAAAVSAVTGSAEAQGAASFYALTSLLFANVIGLRAATLLEGERGARFRTWLARERAIERADRLDLLMPLCRGCGQIRDDAGYWQDVVAYLEAHSDYRFSHGICPACVRAHFPELADEILKGSDAPAREG